jgi:hypothetical protein
MRCDHVAATVKTKDARSPLKRAEHDDNPLVLAQMRDWFSTATGVFLVCDFPWTEDAERIATFWREIDVSVGGERSCCHEEEVLLLDPLAQFGIDIVALLAHPRDKKAQFHLTEHSQTWLIIPGQFDTAR